MDITNSTQGVPLHRDDRVCRRSDWMDVLTFLALDFGLRAVTVLTPPGSTGLHSALICLWSLICPAYGVRRALIAVGFTEDGDSELEESIKKAWRRLTARIQRKSEIDMALRSGALCMLVPSSASKRLSLNPPNDHKEPGPEGLPLETINPLMTSVHGQYPPDIKPLSHQDQSLDEEGGKGFEYSLVKVPPSLKVFPIIKEHDPGPLIKRIWRWVSNKPEEPVKHLHKKAVPLRLSSNERIVKALCTIFQLLYGSYELYKMGGDHLKKYGYAAYEFTIIPYLSMSLMNLLVSCVRPTYPTMYIVYYRGTEEHIPTDGRNPSDNNQRTTTDEDQGKPALNQLEVVPVDEKEGADGNQNLDYLKDWWNPSNSEFEENVSGAIGYAYGDLSGKDGSGPGKRHHIFSLSTWTRRFKANPIFTPLVLAIYILLYYAAPYIIIQILTGFDRGKSTPLQRSCIIMWIASGQFCPDFIEIIDCLLSRGQLGGASLNSTLRKLILGILYLTLIGGPTCAGVYMVATMILEGNTCAEL